MKEVNWMVDTLTNTVEELYKLYYRDIVRFFAEHLADREACWDLCHEVYVRLLITLASGTRLQYPQRWLMRVAKNLLIDTYRHQQAASEANLPGDSHELAMLASDAMTFKTLLERADMLDVIVETFRALPEKQLQHIETHERDYFEQIAPTWDDYVASAYEVELQERLTRLLPWRQEMTVLDVGTGTGYLAGMMAPLVGEVIGVDCAPAMLTRAGEKMVQAGYQHVSFREGMAEHLPLATGSVDVAMCHMLLHHVVSPRTVLAELRRVVRPGGYVLIIDAHTHPHHWTPQAFGDLHYGTDLKKLQKHLKALRMNMLQVEDAGVSHSGNFIGRAADFRNFLILGQVNRRGGISQASERRGDWRNE